VRSAVNADATKEEVGRLCISSAYFFYYTHAAIITTHSRTMCQEELVMRIYFVSEHQESTRITYALSKLKAVMQGLELAYSVHPLQAKSQPIINQEADTSIQDSELFVLIGHEQLERYNVQPLHKELASEGFELRKERTDNQVRLYVLGHDETGVMY